MSLEREILGHLDNSNAGRLNRIQRTTQEPAATTRAAWDRPAASSVA